RAYENLIGRSDDGDLLYVSGVAQNALQGKEIEKALDDAREQLSRHVAILAGKGHINDQVAFPPSDKKLAAKLSFRILSSYQPPDAQLVQQITDIRSFKRDYPEGMELCTALGSAFARKELQSPERDKLLTTLEQSSKLFGRGSLYQEYLHALRALFEKPEPE